MYKAWLSLFPILCCLLSCDALSTGGNPSEGICSYSLKKHSTQMLNSMSVSCLYESGCNINFSFGIAGSEDCGGCVCNYEYKFVQNSKSALVKFNSNLVVNLDPDEHVRFSLFDSENIEKKYDIDLSGIINSYTIRDDSIEVRKFECLKKMNIYKYRSSPNNGLYDIIDLYPDSLKNEKYVFFRNNLYLNEIYFNCGLGSQSSFQTDSIYLYGSFYWR